ncbi:MAG: hypothetical protein K6E51_11225 [Treponema sp.]|nr:hypothetical protein [Treponema sp.]
MDSNKMKSMVKITGTNTYIDVEIDGKTVRIAGEMIMGGFVCYKHSMTHWLIPENEPLTEDDKKHIIDKVTQKTAGSHMVITFDGENPAKPESKKEGLSIVPKDTSEKYLRFMSPIVNGLVDLLKKLNEMIEAQNDKEAEAEQNNRFDRDAFDRFLEHYRDVITPYCTTAFRNKWYRDSVGKPGDYYYLNKTATVYFTMKSESKAVVFLEPAPECYGECYKFELKNESGKYLIDKMFYYFAGDHVYHKMHWL